MNCALSTGDYDIIIPPMGSCTAEVEYVGIGTIEVVSSKSIVTAEVINQYGQTICTGIKNGLGMTISNCSCTEGTRILFSQSTNSNTQVNYAVYPVCQQQMCPTPPICPSGSNDIGIGIFIGIVIAIFIGILLVAVAHYMRRRNQYRLPVAKLDTDNAEPLNEDG